MKYLLEVHHGIGDIVQITGVLDSIKAYDPDAYIGIILGKEPYAELFHCDTRVQKLFRIDLKASKRLLIENIIKIRKERFDYFFLSPISNRRASQVLAFLTKAKQSYGEQLEEFKLFRRRYHAVQRKEAHIVERNRNVVLSAGIPQQGKIPRLCCEATLPVTIPHKSVGLCIGTSIPQKTWDLQKYVEVAEELSKDGYHIVILGGKQEMLRCQEAGIVQNEWIDLAGKLSLAGSAAACRYCDLVIGGDTGLIHIAAAMGCKTLALFSCTDPMLHSPYSDKSFFYKIDLPCQFCYEQGNEAKCSNYRCIHEISSTSVIVLARSILQGVADKKFQYEIG